MREGCAYFGTLILVNAFEDDEGVVGGIADGGDVAGPLDRVSKGEARSRGLNDGLDENQVISSSWTPSFYGYDGAGSVRQLTNNAGAVTDTYEYDAWGNEVNFTGTTPNSYLYRGEQYDSDLSLYYLLARYYNPLTGRFLSRDPEDGHDWDPRSLQKYLYAGGDPVNGVAPNGKADLAEYEVRLNQFLRKAPPLTVWAKQLASCLVGLGKAVYSWSIKGNEPSIWDIPTIVTPCSIFFLSSFQIVYAATP